MWVFIMHAPCRKQCAVAQHTETYWEIREINVILPAMARTDLKPSLTNGRGVNQTPELIASYSYSGEFTQRRRRRQKENGKKAIGLDQQNNSFARASHSFVDFSAVVAQLQRETA